MTELTGRVQKDTHAPGRLVIALIGSCQRSKVIDGPHPFSSTAIMRRFLKHFGTLGIFPQELGQREPPTGLGPLGAL